MIRLMRWWLGSPGMAGAAVLSAAVGVGVVALTLSFTLQFVWPDLPYLQPERLITFEETGILPPESWGGDRVVSRSILEDLERETGLFQAAHQYRTNVPLVFGDDRYSTLGVVARHDFLAFLGLSPRLGRSFLPEEDEPGKGQVIVLSDRFWRTRFAGDPGILGREIRTGGWGTFTVVGVMGPEDLFPDRSGMAFYLPLGNKEGQRLAEEEWVQVLARLAAGVTKEQAHAVAVTLAARHGERNRALMEEVYRVRGAEYLAPEEPVALRVQYYRGRPLHSEERGILLLVDALGGLVFLVALLTLGSVTLLASISRRVSLGIRAALGADPGRIAFGLALEVLVLAAVGGGMGVLGAGALLRKLQEWADPGFQSLVPGLSLPVVLVCLGIILLTGVAAGVWPSLRMDWKGIHGLLQARDVSWLRSQHPGILQRAVVTEVAAVSVLLLGGFLFTAALDSYSQQDRGFDASGLWVASLSVPEDSSTMAAAPALIEAVAAELLGTGIASAATVGGVPVPGGIVVESRIVEVSEDRYLPGFQWINAADHRYFEALGIPLQRGRGFTPEEVAHGSPVAVMDRSLAELLWPQTDPLGRTVRLRLDSMTVALEVVGLTGALPLRLGDGSLSHIPQLHIPLGLRPSLQPQLLFRTDRPPTAQSAVVGALSVGPGEVRVLKVESVPDLLRGRASLQLFLRALFLALAGTGLVLSVLGLYVVLGFVVSRRIPEFGVRLALGSTRGAVATLALSQSLRLVGSGLLLGLPLGILASQSLRSLLLGLSPFHFASIIGVGGLLLLVAVLAGLGPSVRAARTDPCALLRIE